MEYAVQLENVEVRRAGQPILKHVTWSVKPGENWVVLGPNGAGKTTLVRLLTGRVFPSYSADAQSFADVLGYRLGRVDVNELRTAVGMCSTSEDVLFDANEVVTDLLLSTLYGKTVRGREQYEGEDLSRAHDLLQVFGVGQLATRRFGTLSQGERQRVLIARALMADPQILILDEPFAGLDMGARELLMVALEEIAGDRRAPALLLVTHHVEEIPRGFTHAALMDAGSIAQAGPIEDVLVDDTITSVFGVPLTISQVNGRWHAQSKEQR